MTQLPYNGNERMADIMTTHSGLIELLPRFGIALGFGDRTVKEVCAKWNVDMRFFLMICNVYVFDDYEPLAAEVEKTDMSHLVGYLKASHDYYLKKRLPHISSHLHHIANELPHKVAGVFLRFFDLYRDEVSIHFKQEEDNVFPFIEKMLNGELVKKPVVRDLNTIHSDIEDKLEDLTKIIFKYLPETVAKEDTIDVVSDLIGLSHDLRKHSLIEEKILVPVIEHLCN